MAGRFRFLTVLPVTARTPARKRRVALLGALLDSRLADWYEMDVVPTAGPWDELVFALRFSESFRKNRPEQLIKQVEERTLGRSKDQDFRHALGRYSLGFEGRLTSTGVLTLDYEVPKEWSARAQQITKNELHTPFYVFAATVLAGLVNQGDARDGPFYRGDLCVIAPPDQCLMDLQANLTRMSKEPAEVVASKAGGDTAPAVSKLAKRPLHPGRVLKLALGTELLTLSDELTEKVHSMWTVHQTISLLHLPLQELGLDQPNAHQAMCDAHAVGGAERFVDFIRARHDSMVQLVSLAIALLGILVGVVLAWRPWTITFCLQWLAWLGILVAAIVVVGPAMGNAANHAVHLYNEARFIEEESSLEDLGSGPDAGVEP